LYAPDRVFANDYAGIAGATLSDFDAAGHVDELLR